jgi:hypothetical protein
MREIAEAIMLNEDLRKARLGGQEPSGRGPGAETASKTS